MFDVNGLLLANKFEIPPLSVEAFETWDSKNAVGVIGMDILSKLTFIMSHELNQFLLTDSSMPSLLQVFKFEGAG